MAASLKGVDPALKKYLRINKLPDLYEALLTGLAVMCPDDPHTFIIECLEYIQNYGKAGMEWDMFVDEDMKPKNRIISESNLDDIFNLDEYSLQPTPEMYLKAHTHYNLKMKTLCFSGWMQFHLRKKKKRLDLLKKNRVADIHHSHRKLRLCVREWLQWVKFRKGRQAMAYNKIRHVNQVVHGKVIFREWHHVTMDAKKTREYFELLNAVTHATGATKIELLKRLERGENMEDDDLFGLGTGEARDDISMLPRRAQLRIFGNLDIADLARCACVCRQWKVITQISTLWTQMSFYEVRDRVTDNVTKRLLQKCRPYLVHLNLRGCSKITRETFLSVSECRNLQDLNLSECASLNDATLKVITEGATILLYLNISHTCITDAAMRITAQNLVNLQYLSLAHCRRFSDKGLLYLAMGDGASKLIYLDLSGCVQLSSEGYANLATGCKNIEHLILNEYPVLSDDCIQNITETCKKIRTFSVLGSPHLSDDSFKRIAAGRKLGVVKIEGNQKITDATFKAFGKLCPDLHHLYCVDSQNLTDTSLKYLNTCRNITVLNLADCVRITDNGVRYIVDSPCGAKLRELNLTNCIRVGDMALVNIWKRCHSLAYLSVCFCEHITDTGIEMLGQTHSLTSLDVSGCNCSDQGLSALGNNPRFRDVNLSECIAITDLGLQKFAQQCKEIERLDLSFCSNLTDGAIKNLAFCCRKLNVLNLAGCKLLTDLSVQYLSGVCHYLTSLDLSACPMITDKSLRYMKKGCKQMHTLILLYCKAISKTAVQKMMKHVGTVCWNDDDIPAYFQ